MNNKDLRKSKIAKALYAECRLQLLEWLTEPDRHFGNRLKLKGRRSAVATKDIEQKWNVSNQTARRHIGLLRAAGLVTIERGNSEQWVSRSGKGIATARSAGHLYLR